MSETEEDKSYYQAAEAAFIRRRGTPFLLSPRDFALLAEWRALGVPIEAVEQGIDETFSRREERLPARSGRVNSLSYCRGAVLEAWERRAQASVGRTGPRPREEPNVASAVDGLAHALSRITASRPDLAAPLDLALQSLARLRQSGKSAEEMEASLARLDKRLARELYETLPEEERKALDSEVEKALARAGLRMDADTARRTAGALTRRTLRDRLDLPRLTLL